MASFTINVTTPDVTADDLARAGKSQRSLSNVAALLQGLAKGVKTGTINIQTSQTNAVSAAATATITYASIAAADTITLFGVTLTCRASGAVADEFNKTTDATVTAANLVTAANANATIAKYCTASSALGVVTFTVKARGELGNFLKDITKSSSGIALVQWAGGTGGATGAVTSYIR